MAGIRLRRHPGPCGGTHQRTRSQCGLATRSRNPKLLSENRAGRRFVRSLSLNGLTGTNEPAAIDEARELQTGRPERARSGPSNQSDACYCLPVPMAVRSHANFRARRPCDDLAPGSWCGDTEDQDQHELEFLSPGHELESVRRERGASVDFRLRAKLGCVLTRHYRLCAAPRCKQTETGVH